MQPMPSVDQYTQQERAQLLALARQSIESELSGARIPIPSESSAESLRAIRACFVTLKLAGRLRGCIGNLQAESSLADGVIMNARRAAFHDPRFMPLTEEELESITIEISILTEPERLLVRDETELLEKLRPGIDGLIIRYQSKQATFLPAVWEQLAEPSAFVTQLKLKAGLAPDFWNGQMECEIYQAIKVSE